VEPEKRIGSAIAAAALGAAAASTDPASRLRREGWTLHDGLDLHLEFDPRPGAEIRLTTTPAGGDFDAFAVRTLRWRPQGRTDRFFLSDREDVDEAAVQAAEGLAIALRAALHPFVAVAVHLRVGGARVGRISGIRAGDTAAAALRLLFSLRAEHRGPCVLSFGLRRGKNGAEGVGEGGVGVAFPKVLAPADAAGFPSFSASRIDAGPAETLADRIAGAAGEWSGDALGVRSSLPGGISVETRGMDLWLFADGSSACERLDCAFADGFG